MNDARATYAGLDQLPNFGKVLAVLPGWIAFGFTIRKAWFERTILEFALSSKIVDADDDERPYVFSGGMSGVRVLFIDVTNNGLRPITIQQFECRFAFLDREQQRHETKSTAWLDQKIGQGDHCVGLPRINPTLTEILSVCAIDSTGKRWDVSAKVIKQLNAKGQPGVMELE